VKRHGQCFDQDDGDDEKKHQGLPNYIDRMVRRLVHLVDHEVIIEGPEQGGKLGRDWNKMIRFACLRIQKPENKCATQGREGNWDSPLPASKVLIIWFTQC
jgi:hypothetical protein